MVFIEPLPRNGSIRHNIFSCKLCLKAELVPHLYPHTEMCQVNKNNTLSRSAFVPQRAHICSAKRTNQNALCMVQTTTRFSSPWGATEFTHFQRLQRSNSLASYVQRIITMVNLIGLHWKHTHTERIKSSAILM
jgi:hypothetical protein